MTFHISRRNFLAKCFVGIPIAFFTLANARALDFAVKDLRIEHPFARPTMPGMTSGAIYLTITNRSNEADWLVKASSSIMQTVELHSMTMDNNIMRMREVAGIEIPPGKSVVMKPGGHEGGGYHVMLNRMVKPLKEGDKFPLTLTFRKAGSVEITVPVESD